MRKNLNLKTSWYTSENWNSLIEDGFLPVLAIQSPETHKGTPIHFPEIAPRTKDLDTQEFLRYLEKKVSARKIINSFDILSHISCAPKGVVLLTDKQDDPYREILREYLGRYLDSEITEYEYH